MVVGGSGEAERGLGGALVGRGGEVDDVGGGREGGGNYVGVWVGRR